MNKLPEEDGKSINIRHLEVLKGATTTGKPQQNLRGRVPQRNTEYILELLSHNRILAAHKANTKIAESDAVRQRGPLSRKAVFRVRDWPSLKQTVTRLNVSMGQAKGVDGLHARDDILHHIHRIKRGVLVLREVDEAVKIALVHRSDNGVRGLGIPHETNDVLVVRERATAERDQES